MALGGRGTTNYGKTGGKTRMGKLTHPSQVGVPGPSRSISDLKGVKQATGGGSGSVSEMRSGDKL